MNTLWLAAALLLQDDVSKLMADLGADKPETRDAAATALVALGDKAVDALKKAAASTDPDLSARATDILGRIDAAKFEKAWETALRAAPKSFADRTYSVTVDGKAAGSARFKTREEKGELILDDVLDMEQDDKKLSIAAVTTTSAGRYPSPRKLAVKVRGRESFEFETFLEDGALSVTNPDGETQSVKVTDRTVTLFALFRVVEALPCVRDRAVVFDLIIEREMRFRGNQTLVCDGLSTIAIGEKKVEAWKWEVTADSRKQQFWVKDGRLLRVTIDEKFELTIKE